MLSGEIAFNYKGVLYTQALATGQQRRYEGLPLMLTPAWHPQGRYIAFGRQYVYLLDTVTGQVERLTSGEAYDGDPSWSPDGSQIIAARISVNPGLYLLDRASQTYTAIKVKGENAAFQPAWSPDGKSIAFVITIEGHHQIFVMDSSSLAETEKEAKQLTSQRSSFAPAWSPDSRQIVFSRKEGLYYSVWLMNADGSEQRQICETVNGDFAPTWSPDGNYIAFERYDGKDYQIYAMRSDGSELEQITQNGGKEPSWWMPES